MKNRRQDKQAMGVTLQKLREEPSYVRGVGVLTLTSYTS